MSLLELLQEGRVEDFNAQRGRYATPDLFAADLANLDLTGVDLSGANLEKSDLSGTNLTDAILARANLSGADLTAANLTRVVAVRSRWREAYLGEAVLDGAELTGSDFAQAELNEATGENVRLGNARLKGADLSQVYLAGVELGGANLKGATLSGATMTNANLAEARLSGAVLDGADLSGSDMRDVRASGISAQRANFTSAILINADLTSANFTMAVLNEAKLERADLTGAVIEGASFQTADIYQTRLDDVNLESADFEGAISERSEGGEVPAGDGTETAVFMDVDTVVSSESMAVLWENEDSDEGMRLRVAVSARAGNWDGRCPRVDVPTELVLARAIVPAKDGLYATAVVRRPSGDVLMVTEISATGDMGATRTLPLYPLAVQPVVVPDGDGFLVYGLARTGPTLLVHRYDGEELVLLSKQRQTTARGFIGRREPVLLCKGNVILPIDRDGAGQPMGCPDGFPGRNPAACRVGEDVILAWAPNGKGGVHYATISTRGPGDVRRLDVKHGTSSLDVVRVDDQALLVFAREEGEEFSTTSLFGAWIPGGRSFLLLAGGDEDVDEARACASNEGAFVSAVTLGGGVHILEVGENSATVIGEFR